MIKIFFLDARVLATCPGPFVFLSDRPIFVYMYSVLVIHMGSDVNQTLCVSLFLFHTPPVVRNRHTDRTTTQCSVIAWDHSSLAWERTVFYKLFMTVTHWRPGSKSECCNYCSGGSGGLGFRDPEGRTQLNSCCSQNQMTKSYAFPTPLKGKIPIKENPVRKNTLVSSCVSLHRLPEMSYSWGPEPHFLHHRIKSAMATGNTH